MGYAVQQKQDGHWKKKSEQLKNDLARFHFLYAEVGTDAQAKGPGEPEEDAGFLE